MATQYGNNIYLPPSPVIPKFLVISNISNSSNAVVTVTTLNQYIAQQIVYFSVPFDYGMFQINGLSGEILSVDSTNLIFTVKINTTQFDAFSIPVGGEQPATLAPAGARNEYNILTVPFHSQNGQIGN